MATKKTKHDRQIHEDIHDLIHMFIDAKRWIDSIDKKLQEIMIRENNAVRKEKK